jgi:hypothetical protein
MFSALLSVMQIFTSLPVEGEPKVADEERTLEIVARS